MQRDIVPQFMPAPNESQPLSTPIGQGPVLGSDTNTELNQLSRKQKRLAHWVGFSAVLILLFLVGLGGWVLYRTRISNAAKSTPLANADDVTYTALGQSGIKLAAASVSAKQLTVTSTLNVSGQLVVAPTARPSAPALGLIYLDSTDHTLYFYDGSNFDPLIGAAGVGSIQDGLPGPPGADGIDGDQGPPGADGSDNCIGGSCVSLQPTSPGTQETGNINIAGTLAIDSGSGSIILGDVSGDARGAGAVDLQSGRTAATHVSAGTNSVAVGYDDTAGMYGAADVALGVQAAASSNTIGFEAVALGVRVSAGTGDLAIGRDTTAMGGNSIAIGWVTTATGLESLSLGRLSLATGSQAQAVGYQNSATGYFSDAFGSRATAAGRDSLALGGNIDTPVHANGDYSISIGQGTRVEGNNSLALGSADIIGYTERVFTIAAGGTAVTLAGGNYTSEFSNGDTVIITMNQDWGDSLNAERTMSGLTYNSGPNTTTFALSSAIDLTTTGGRVADQLKAQRSVAIGAGNQVTANDAYILGEGITNGIQGSVQIGTSNTAKVTIDASGRLGIATTTPGNLLSVGALTTAAPTAQISVSTGGTTSSGIVIQDVVGQSSGYLLQAQDSTGASLASIDYLGNLIVKNATINGHIISGGPALSGSNIAVGANCGTGCTVGVTGNDTAGLITINAGTGGAAGILANLTFATAYTSGSAPLVTLTPVTVPASSNFPEYYYSASNSGFVLKSYNALSDSETYTFSYHVIQ